MKPASEFIISTWPKKVTVNDARTWIILKDDKSKKELIDLIKHRFHHRYIAPLENIGRKYKSGFLIMATSCLMIEALESFYEGLESTNRKSRNVFINFFKRNIDYFPDVDKDSANFYTHIRCGLLHQAETTGGWRISRNAVDPIFSKNEKVINSNKFFKSLKTCLKHYTEELEKSNFNSIIWINALKKIEFICKNCE